MNTNYKKSSFKYWLCHWCAFNMTALNLGCWKFIYLFHDIEKPWLRLFLPYKIVRKIHRKISRHHIECIFKKDYTAMMIDMECSRLTKFDSPYTAREYASSGEMTFDKSQILIKCNQYKI